MLKKLDGTTAPMICRALSSPGMVYWFEAHTAELSKASVEDTMSSHRNDVIRVSIRQRHEERRFADTKNRDRCADHNPQNANHNKREEGRGAHLANCVPKFKPEFVHVSLLLGMQASGSPLPSLTRVAISTGQAAAVSRISRRLFAFGHRAKGIAL